MARGLLYIPMILLFVSCVSKKKYNVAQQRQEQLMTEKMDLEALLGKLSVENDSLKKRVTWLDSVFIAERKKANSIPTETPKANKPGGNRVVESDKKALYIYNIPNYVFWPQSVKTDKFLIGIIGDSKLNAALANYMYGKSIHQLPAIVEPYVPAAGKFYHMVFIAESKQKDFHRIKKELKNQPVLLIVENRYLENEGAHVSIYAEGDKVKFSVNKKHIEKVGLNVSESLIKLSKAQ
jgi:hypothetical protein